MIGEEILAQLQKQIAGKSERSINGAENETGDESETNIADGHDMFSSSVVMDEEQLDDETNAQLSQIFGNSRTIKSEYDNEINNLTDGNDSMNNFGNNNLNNMSCDIDDVDGNASKSHNSVLQNLSALFSASGGGFDYNSKFNSVSSGNGILNMSDDRSNNMFGLSNNTSNNNIMLNHNNNPIRRRAPRGCGTNQRLIFY